MINSKKGKIIAMLLVARETWTASTYQQYPNIFP